MELSEEQQRMYDGEFGEGTQAEMEILVALGKIFGAKQMIPITSAQIAGVSYKTIGDAGLDYIREMSRRGAKVRIPSFLNPAGMDREQWEEMKFPKEFAKKQLEILDTFASMGISMTCTCTPYLIGIRPKKGEHVAWAESSAVSFCNSMLGARTNREGGPSALAAAVCGCTPEYGLHLDENRVSDLIVKVDAKLEKHTDYGAMGTYIGKLAKSRFPAFVGMENPGEDRMKVLGASMAASGSVPLYYAKGITPEFVVKEDAEEIVFGKSELEQARESIGTNEKPDLVTIGCPHASIDEIREVAKKVGGKKVMCELWVCTARKTKQEAEKLGLVKIIEDAGGKVVADTCMVVAPIEDMGHCITGCNSGKAAKYLRNLCRQKVVFMDIDDIAVE